MRIAEVTRKTKETDIRVSLVLDGTGEVNAATGLPFFDHMLTAMAKHGGFDLLVQAEGDLAVDSHHTVEDTGLVLGEAIREAVGEGHGIRRFAHAIVPMDEALATVAMDCGGRGHLVFRGCFSQKTLGTMDPEVFEHFFQSLCAKAGLSAHLLFQGRNDHHQCEALFKAFGIALGEAVSLRPGRTDIPSTKGTF